MDKKLLELYKNIIKQNLSEEEERAISKEMELINDPPEDYIPVLPVPGIYDKTDMEVLHDFKISGANAFVALKTLDELLEQDKQREEDGFPRKIRIGKLIKPEKGSKGKIVVVPTTTESKFYHDDSITEDGEQSTGGSGEGEEGDVIGEQPAQPQKGEGEGQGAGEGGGGNHDISSKAFDLGKIITEKFQLPNLKDKGKKRSLTKYTYDLTDRNKGFGQVLDKKETLRRIIKTNILLKNIDEKKPFSGEDLILNPQDQVYRILSKEKDYETQAVVFFLRDYSGSMQGAPTEAVSSQHLLIYSWLMYQYQNNVETRFILHDTEAKEVEDFYTYYSSQVAGGTRVAPAFELVNKIIEEEQLHTDNNIYVFHGTDGDDWDSDGKDLIKEIKKLLKYSNRTGITVAQNSWSSGGKTTVEKNIENSGILKEQPELLRIDTFKADGVTEERIIESIKRLIG